MFFPRQHCSYIKTCGIHSYVVNFQLDFVEITDYLLQNSGFNSSPPPPLPPGRICSSPTSPSTFKLNARLLKTEKLNEPLQKPELERQLRTSLLLSIIKWIRHMHTSSQLFKRWIELSTGQNLHPVNNVRWISLSNFGNTVARSSFLPPL